MKRGNSPKSPSPFHSVLRGAISAFAVARGRRELPLAVTLRFASAALVAFVHSVFLLSQNVQRPSYSFIRPSSYRSLEAHIKKSNLASSPSVRLALRFLAPLCRVCCGQSHLPELLPRLPVSCRPEGSVRIDLSHQFGNVTLLVAGQWHTLPPAPATALALLASTLRRRHAPRIRAKGFAQATVVFRHRLEAFLVAVDFVGFRQQASIVFG